MRAPASSYGSMFQFFHPRPVVDRRPVAEHSVRVQAVALPALTALAPAAPAGEAPALSPPAAPSVRGPASARRS